MSDTTARMHRCPGCRSKEIEWPRLVCQACWTYLPLEHRQALIAVADRSNPNAWGVAVNAALDWIVTDRATRLYGTERRRQRRAA